MLIAVTIEVTIVLTLATATFVKAVAEVIVVPVVCFKLTTSITELAIAFKDVCNTLLFVTFCRVVSVLTPSKVVAKPDTTLVTVVFVITELIAVLASVAE